MAAGSVAPSDSVDGANEGSVKHYDSLFSRDVSVCVLGALASGDKQLIAAARTSLQTLASAQADNGQLPFYYKPEMNEVKWWYPGSIDGTIWWAIAALSYVAETNDQDFYTAHKAAIEKAFVWLTYQDTNNDSLLEQGEAADWADEFPRMGTVLYSNALWYWLVKLRIGVEKRDDLIPLRDKIHEGVNTLLWVHKQNDHSMNYIPDNAYVRDNVYASTIIEWVHSRVVYAPYYLGFISHKSYEMRCDVYGNILACLVGLADEHKTKHIIDFIIRSGCNKPYPVKVTYPPIYPGEREWSDYMAKGRQNYPWQYHNGGIWPYVGGFWVALLARHDKKLALEELENLARANGQNDWEFNEYLHGQHGTGMGIPHQSWNMAAMLFAARALGVGMDAHDVIC